MSDILFQLGISGEIMWAEDDGVIYDLDDIIEEVKSWTDRSAQITRASEKSGALCIFFTKPLTNTRYCGIW